MTMNEVQGFRKVLTARVAELERTTRQRDGITIERSAELLEEVQAASERALAVGNPHGYCGERRVTTAIDRAAPGAACSSPAPRGCIFLTGHPAAEWDTGTVRDALRR